MNDELNEEIQELKKELQEYSNELDKLYSLDNTNSQKTMKIIQEINKEKKELEQKIIVLEREKKELEQKINIVEESKNNINNEHCRLIKYFKKYKVFEKLKKNASESEGSDYEESDDEESEEIKKFNEELMKKYNIDDSNGFDKDGKSKYDSNGFDKDGKHKDTKTKYDSNGFDKDGKHKDTGIFLNKKNINWLKDEDEFLKLYNEIIKNGEFCEKISEKNSISSYDFKKISESILNGKVDDDKILKKIKKINKIENDLNDLKENENINKLKNYIKKLRNSIYGKDKGKIRTEEARSFKDQKRKGYIDLPIFLSKMYINDSSKELINSIKQLINNLYDNKQITKQVFNILNKTITYSKRTYKNDS